MDINNILCYIIPLITAILGWLLRHLTCKGGNNDELELLQSKNAKLQADLDACLNKSNTATSAGDTDLTAKINKLQTDLDAALSSKKKAEHDLDLCLASKASLSSKIASSSGADLGIANSLTNNNNGGSEPTLNFDAAAAKNAIGKKVVADDLKIVEGIGPKIAQLFNDAGISTWYQLSKASQERCQEILNGGGKRYEIHNPGTWPKQAGLAFEGKWKELNDLQDYLDGGVEPK